MSAPTVKQTHPVRGVLWGLMFGIGLAFVLVFTTVINLDLVTMIIVVVIAIALGVLWSLYGPAKPPQGEPPVARVPPPETSRFDDRPAAEMPEVVDAPGVVDDPPPGTHDAAPGAPDDD